MSSYENIGNAIMLPTLQQYC